MTGWHRDSYDYEGYGVYEFTDGMSGYGQLPAGTSIQDVIENMDAYIADVGGIQVAKTEVQQPLIDTLDKMDFVADGDETAVTVTGTASFGLLSFGSDFASEFIADGYVVMGNKASVATGTPKMIMTKIASVIADNAYVGGPYVAVGGPMSLLQQASASLGKGGEPVPPLPPEPSPTPTPSPSPEAPSQAATGGPEWMLPAIVAVGGIALIAAFAAVGSKPKRRGAR
jgi:hypothetical protein